MQKDFEILFQCALFKLQHWPFSLRCSLPARTLKLNQPASTSSKPTSTSPHFLLRLSCSSHVQICNTDVSSFYHRLSAKKKTHLHSSYRCPCLSALSGSPSTLQPLHPSSSCGSPPFSLIDFFSRCPRTCSCNQNKSLDFLFCYA